MTEALVERFVFAFALDNLRLDFSDGVIVETARRCDISEEPKRRGDGAGVIGREPDSEGSRLKVDHRWRGSFTHTCKGAGSFGDGSAWIAAQRSEENSLSREMGRALLAIHFIERSGAHDESDDDLARLRIVGFDDVLQPAVEY